LQEILVTPQEAAAEHRRIRRLARERRTDELIDELKNPRRFRLLSIRGAAASRLGLLGARNAAHPVAELLSDPVAQVRQAAARALGRIGVADAEILAALFDVASHDSDDDVRGVAIGSLGELGDPEAAEHLTPFLSEHGASVRMPAIYALLLADDPTANRLAMEQLRRERWYMWPYRRRLAKDLRHARRSRRNA
jgi:HEAT repeat protein